MSAAVFVCIAACSLKDRSNDPMSTSDSSLTESSDHASSHDGRGMPVGTSSVSESLRADPVASQTLPAAHESSGSTSAPRIAGKSGTGASLVVDLENFALDSKDYGTGAVAVVAGDFMGASTFKGYPAVWRRKGNTFDPIYRAGWVSLIQVAMTTGVKTRLYIAYAGWLTRHEWDSRATQFERRSDEKVGKMIVVASDVTGWNSAAADSVLDISKSSELADVGRTELGVAVFASKPKARSKERRAKVWVEGQKPVLVGNDSGGATSASLLPLGPRRFLILTLDGQPDKSPIHAIPLEIDEKGAAVLGEDQTVYVAGKPGKRSTVRGVLVGGNPFVVHPTWKTSQDFGMLVHRVGAEAAGATWIDYPRDIDPAPFDVGTVCGLPVVAFTRPETKDAKTDKILEIGWLRESGEIQDRLVIDSSRRIEHVAISGENSGGWVIYSTSHELRARRITCH